MMIGVSVVLHVTGDVGTLRGNKLIQTLNDVERVQAELDALRLALVRQAHNQAEAELDGCDPQQRGSRSTRACLSATLEGVQHLSAVLDPEAGAEFAAVLDDIDHEL